jgi:large subunit ribosomal protein L6
MSRIGKSPIPVPRGVEVTIGQGTFSARGPKGELQVNFNPDLTVEREGAVLHVKRPSDSRTHRSLHGLTRTLIFNAVHGVDQGYSKALELQGVGFRANVDGSGQLLNLTLGFSHPVQVKAPEGIRFEVKDQTQITVAGIDKQLVGQVAADIRKIRKPDVYHGKGVRYLGERIRLKAGKAGATGGKQ